VARDLVAKLLDKNVSRRLSAAAAVCFSLPLSLSLPPAPSLPPSLPPLPCPPPQGVCRGHELIRDALALVALLYVVYWNSYAV